MIYKPKYYWMQKWRADENPFRKCSLTHTHTHTHIYIERERKRERERGGERCLHKKYKIT